MFSRFADRLPFYRHVLLALAALVAAWIPAVVAIDHGGVLDYDWWAVSLLAIALTLCVLTDVGAVVRHRYWGVLPALLLLLFAGFAWLQTLPLPASVAQYASPGAAVAYRQWLPPALGEAAPGSFPISVSGYLTAQFAARASIIAAFAFAASILFVNRDRIRILLYGLCCAGVLHAAAGIVLQVAPADVGIEETVEATGGHPFGFFVNRNNAAGLINVGLAAAVGLIAFRFASLASAPSASRHAIMPARTTGVLFRRTVYGGGPGSPLHDKLERCLGDGPLWFASIAAAMAFAGILASGSRGAFFAMLAGAAACLLILMPLRRAAAFSAGAVIVLGIAWLSLSLLGVRVESIDRLAAADAVALADDGRLAHWPDAWRAAGAYFPLGAGMGAYRYAYLPYQQSSHAMWYQNADNLWIEWLVEGGAVAVILVLAALALIVVALRRLLASLDPVDRGLAVAGCFCLAAMLVSQAFDFALLYPPTAIGAVMIMAAVVARAAVLPGGAPIDGAERPVWIGAAAGAVVLFAAIVASSSIATAARGDAIISRSRVVRSGDLRHLDELRAAEAALSDYLRRAPENQQARLERVAVRVKLYRVMKTVHSGRIGKSQIQQAYRQTAVAHERRRYYSSVDGALGDRSTGGGRRGAEGDMSHTIDFSTPRWAAATMLPFLAPARQSAASPSPVAPPAVAQSTSTKGFEAGMDDAERPSDYLSAAADDARRALRTSPLSDLPRMWLVWLDYATGETELTEARLVQAAVLRSQSPDQLRKIGTAAAAARRWDVARSVWLQAIALSPKDLIPLIREVRESGELEVNDIIPPTRDAILAAARIELRQQSPDKLLLARARRTLAEERHRGRLHSTEDAELLEELEARGERREARG